MYFLLNFLTISQFKHYQIKKINTDTNLSILQPKIKAKNKCYEYRNNQRPGVVYHEIIYEAELF